MKDLPFQFDVCLVVVTGRRLCGMLERDINVVASFDRRKAADKLISSMCFNCYQKPGNYWTVIPRWRVEPEYSI
jgi:hypothetical protein